MPKITDRILSSLLENNTVLRLVEPHIYSYMPDVDTPSPYDSAFGNIYDWVACNPVYNRLIWGYSISVFSALTQEALTSSPDGIILDLGCGSLAFTAKTYLQNANRPVVLMDNSIKMLRMAKSRLINLNGTVPDNMIFLHGDATELPFQKTGFTTILALNILHCLTDTKRVLSELNSILAEGGRMYFTTLVKGNRWADRYLMALANAGKLVPRDMDQHHAVFQELGIPAKSAIFGNLAVINCS
jgi:SAM-dependent methyltransferase